MKLTNAIEEFLFHCQFEKNLSGKTLKAYKTDLFQFAAFLQEEIIMDINKQEIKNYLASIYSLKPKTIKRKIASTKALFSFLEFEDKIASNPFRKMRINIKEPQVLRTVMDINEITKLFKLSYKLKADASSKEGFGCFETVRNTIVLELLFNTGARVSEISELKINDIDLRAGSILIKGKGSKERIIHICNTEALILLNFYYKNFHTKISQANGYFLVNRFHKKLSDQSIRNIVKKISFDAKLTKHITPHVFRHTFATLLLEKDVDLRYIQSLLGHSSIVTTQLYAHVNHKKQKQILTSKHPRKDIKMVFEGE